MMHLHPKPLNEIIKKTIEDNEYKTGALIEHHYLANNCFLEPGFFLTSENLNKIIDIPMIIVQGRYDMVAPIASAYELHKNLPKSIIIITMAGHGSLDEDNVTALINATDSFI
jgi:proline iminopeptidase